MGSHTLLLNRIVRYTNIGFKKQEEEIYSMRECDCSREQWIVFVIVFIVSLRLLINVSSRKSCDFSLSKHNKNNKTGRQQLPEPTGFAERRLF